MPSSPPHRPPLDPTTVRAPGWRVEVLAQSPSTNRYVAARARAGEAPGLVVVAEHQTAGRGRLDRSWVTPPRAALTFSVLLAPDRVPAARWPWLPLVAGLAVVEGVRAGTGLEPVLKWPNDVLLLEGGTGDDERKVAGILVERVERRTGPVAVAGVGLNVSTTRAELPVGTATSLALAGAAATDRGEILAAVLEGLGRLVEEWQAVRGRGPRAAYTQACGTLGRRVRVELPGGRLLQGLAADVDEDGRLLVDDGRRVHVLGAGDVVHVRASPPTPE